MPVTITQFPFLLKSNSQPSSFVAEIFSNVNNYAFVAQHLGVLGLIKLCDDETENLYCLTDAGFQTINKIHEDTKQGIQDSD